jgi:hypothetical protein
MDIAFYELAWRKLNPTSPRPAGGSEEGEPIFAAPPEIKKPPKRLFYFWRRGRDSNPR